MEREHLYSLNYCPQHQEFQEKTQNLEQQLAAAIDGLNRERAQHKEAVQEAATAVDTYGEVIEVDVEALVKEASEKLGQESLSDITYDLEQGTANLVEAVDIFNDKRRNLSLITTDFFVFLCPLLDLISNTGFCKL